MFSFLCISEENMKKFQLLDQMEKVDRSFRVLSALNALFHKYFNVCI